MSEQARNQQIGKVIARLRDEASITQEQLAEKSSFDKRRISQIEKGEFAANADVKRVVGALDALGSPNAKEFERYIGRKWHHIEPPSFWNPERECLEATEDALDDITKFLGQDDHPWPLRRLIEQEQGSLLRGAGFLGRLNHNIAFIGDIGVGKSTAISVIFDLLVPLSSSKKTKKKKKTIERTVLETGGGGTTVCEVQIKDGPEIVISLLPMSDAEMRDLVSDFCAAKWSAHKTEKSEVGEKISVSSEQDRAIRNMSGLVLKRQIVDGKRTYQDPMIDLVNSSGCEDELKTQILELMNLEGRTRCELRYDRSTHPMEWIKETFRAVNNGRLKDVPLPKIIYLLIPSFGRAFGELDISVIDTKGVDDIPVREDLDQRLKDPRTAIVFCSSFNDAPGNSARILLKHMRKTFSEHIDNGKVSLMALPRSEEAGAMKDPISGEPVESDDEGYELKRMQILPEFEAESLADVPMLFYNAEIDDASAIRGDLFDQLSRLRKVVENRLVDLRKKSQYIIKNSADQARNAAIEEVTNRLNAFLKGNRSLGAREQLAHAYAIDSIKNVRYPSVVWASTRRNGDYPSLKVVHLIGIGAAQDANRRSEGWFNGFDAFIKSLKADEGLALASQFIDEIAASAAEARIPFSEKVGRGAVEIYEEPLSQASTLWRECETEWGCGPGFKIRVANHLEGWFSTKANLKDSLERKINEQWDKVVIEPLARLVDKEA